MGRIEVRRLSVLALVPRANLRGGRDDAGFEVDTNAVTIVGADCAESLPLQSKARVATVILDRVERLLLGQSASLPSSP